LLIGLSAFRQRHACGAVAQLSAVETRTASPPGCWALSSACVRLVESAAAGNHRPDRPARIAGQSRFAETRLLGALVLLLMLSLERALNRVMSRAQELEIQRLV